MITPEYCVTMASYNAWQNNLLCGAVDELSAEELKADRGAFFGSIWATLNHLIWVDHLWISRFDGGSAPIGGIKEGLNYATDAADWRIKRRDMDARISDWANQVTLAGLTGDLVTQSKIMGRDITKSKALCVTHFFNHQTHHRGQIHAMMTQTGQDGAPSDLFFMAELS
ncbi:DinB family protein [Aestuariibius sp. HNIBRBA575]|uniref:DinB family protein n=1 Tax=Aestuariibius sp. HNIBRBA575 TaxID=3233343 RepID=UPI0034A2C054